MNSVERVKAQVAAEYLIVMAFLLVAVGVLSAYSFITLSESIKARQAINAVDSIANAADRVGALGENSKLVVEVELPDGVLAFKTTGKEVQIQMQSFGNTTDVYTTALFDITPATLSPNSGKALYLVEVVDSNVVVSPA